jgi:hypothetical protein
MAGGVSVNNEQAVDSDPTKNIEALYTFRTSYYSYDRPKTNVDVSLQYYASLNDWGRQRIQLDSAFKREFWKDVFFSLNVFDTFDSRPPTEGADNNDVGVTFAFWVDLLALLAAASPREVGDGGSNSIARTRDARDGSFRLARPRTSREVADASASPEDGDLGNDGGDGEGRAHRQDRALADRQDRSGAELYDLLR